MQKAVFACKRTQKKTNAVQKTAFVLLIAMR